MQVWIINTLYFLRKFEAVIEESDVLEQYLLEHNKDYFKTFYWTLLQSKTIANYYLNRPKQAITMLQSALKNIDKEDADLYKYPLQFNFAVVNFSICQYKTGHKYLNFLNDKEAEAISNKEFLINMKILDILFYYELKDINFALYKNDQLKSKHKHQLREPQYATVKQFVNILHKLIKQGHFTKNLETTCWNYIEANKTTVTNRGINYAIWLEAKLNKEDYYQFLLRKHME